MAAPCNFFDTCSDIAELIVGDSCHREVACTLATLPAPAELVRLQGHRHDVLLMQFAHDGEGIATGSKDGTVRVRSPALPSCST